MPEYSKTRQLTYAPKTPRRSAPAPMRTRDPFADDDFERAYEAEPEPPAEETHAASPAPVLPQAYRPPAPPPAHIRTPAQQAPAGPEHDLHVRHIPDDLYQCIKADAAANRHSIAHRVMLALSAYYLGA